MIKYNFMQMRQQILPVLRVTVSKTQLHIPLETYELMGRPESLVVHYDRKNGAVKLEPNTTDPWARKVKVREERYFSLSITLAKFMPVGVYALEDDKQFIFVNNQLAPKPQSKSNKGEVEQ